MTTPIRAIFTRTFVVLSVYGMAALGLSLMLVTGLPLFLQSRGWAPAQIGLTLGSYFLTSLLVRPLIGRATDRRGPKRVLIAGATLLLIPCPFYLLTDYWTLIVALRVIQGIGWAMATTATATLASQIVPQDRIGLGMGIYGILNGLGFTFGPALGAYALNVSGGTLFVIFASLIAAVVLTCAIIVSPPTPGPSTPLSWDRALALVRTIALPLAITLGVSFGYGAVQTFLPLYARAEGVVNPGLFFTVFSLLSFGSRPGMGRLSDLWGRRATAALLLLCIAGTFAMLAWSAKLPFLIAAGVLYGIGHGAIFTVLMALLTDIVPPSDRGLTFGVFGTAIDLGITLGNYTLSALVGVIGYSGGFVLASTVALLCLPLLLVLRPLVTPAPAVAVR